MIYDTTACCRIRQFRVKPMNRGVRSGTCDRGGTFQLGMDGSSSLLAAAAARGKLSTITMGG